MNIFLTAFFLIVSVVRVEAGSLCSGVLAGSVTKVECTYSSLSSFKRGVLGDIAAWWNQLGKPNDFSIAFNNVPVSWGEPVSRVSIQQISDRVGSLPDALTPETSGDHLVFGDPTKPALLMVFGALKPGTPTFSINAPVATSVVLGSLGLIASVFCLRRCSRRRA